MAAISSDIRKCKLMNEGENVCGTEPHVYVLDASSVVYGSDVQTTVSKRMWGSQEHADPVRQGCN